MTKTSTHGLSPVILALPYIPGVHIGASWFSPTLLPLRNDVQDWNLVSTRDIPYPCRCDEVPPFRDRSCISQVRIAKDHNHIHMKSCSSHKQICTSSCSLPPCCISESLPSRRSFCICSFDLIVFLIVWVYLLKKHVRVLTIRIPSKSLSGLTWNTQLIYTTIFVLLFNHHSFLQNSFVRLFDPFIFVLHRQARASTVGLRVRDVFLHVSFNERKTRLTVSIGTHTS